MALMTQGSFTSAWVSSQLVFKYSTESAFLCHRRSLGDFRVSFLYHLCRKCHVCVFCAEFRTFRRRPFWFWPTNRMWKVPWRRQRSPSVSHSTPSQHTHGTSKPAAHWREKGELNTNLTHSPLSGITGESTLLTQLPPAPSSLCLQFTCQSGLDEGPGCCKLELNMRQHQLSPELNQPFMLLLGH